VSDSGWMTMRFSREVNDCWLMVWCAVTKEDFVWRWTVTPAVKTRPSRRGMCTTEKAAKRAALNAARRSK